MQKMKQLIYKSVPNLLKAKSPFETRTKQNKESTVKQRKLQVCIYNFQVPRVLRLRIARIGDLYLLALKVILIYMDTERST